MGESEGEGELGLEAVVVGGAEGVGGAAAVEVFDAETEVAGDFIEAVDGEVAAVVVVGGAGGHHGVAVGVILGGVVDCGVFLYAPDFGEGAYGIETQAGSSLIRGAEHQAHHRGGVDAARLRGARGEGDGAAGDVLNVVADPLAVNGLIVEQQRFVELKIAGNHCSPADLVVAVAFEHILIGEVTDDAGKADAVVPFAVFHPHRHVGHQLVDLGFHHVAVIRHVVAAEIAARRGVECRHFKTYGEAETAVVPGAVADLIVGRVYQAVGTLRVDLRYVAGRFVEGEGGVFADSEAAVSDICAVHADGTVDAVHRQADVACDLVFSASEPYDREVDFAVERIDEHPPFMAGERRNGDVAGYEVDAVFSIEIVPHVVAENRVYDAADGHHELIVAGSDGEFRGRHGCRACRTGHFDGGFHLRDFFGLYNFECPDFRYHTGVGG